MAACQSFIRRHKVRLAPPRGAGGSDRPPLCQGLDRIRGADAGAVHHHVLSKVLDCVRAMEDVLPKLLFALVMALAALASGPAAAERITVFAAASLKEAMDAAAAAFRTERGIEVVVSLAASSILARQIEAGAPADVFISADQEWMDWLAERGLIREESRRNVAGNDLVIAAPLSVPEGTGPDTLLE